MRLSLRGAGLTSGPPDGAVELSENGPASIGVEAKLFLHIGRNLDGFVAARGTVTFTHQEASLGHDVTESNCPLPSRGG